MRLRHVCLVSVRDPFRIEGPATICFSGGRTSGLMLRRILDAHDGVLPEGVFVTFCNTGVERAETLDFVRDCEDRWSVPIRWLEYRRDPFDPANYDEGKFRSQKGLPYTVEVSYETASRRGEPFFQLIRWQKDYRAAIKGLGALLPNPAMRTCTDQLKIKTSARWMAERGLEPFDSVIGIRADEPRRLSFVRGQFGDIRHPLAAAGVVKADVHAFWKAQPFDLQLDPESDEGNCTLCFMKAREKVVRIMRKTREHDWFWIEAEALTGQTFRKDRSYTKLREEIDSGTCKIGLDAEATGDCFCGTGD